MSDPVIMLVLLVVLLGLLSLGVWVAIALLSVGTIAVVFFSNAPSVRFWPQPCGGKSLMGACCAAIIHPDGGNPAAIVPVRGHVQRPLPMARSPSGALVTR